MAALRLWWHSALPESATGGRMPIPKEPEIGTEAITTSASATASGAAPDLTDTAIVRVNGQVRYRVNGTADATAKVIEADTNTAINVAPGDTISFVDA